MQDYETCSERILIRRARCGDVQAFGILYGRIYKDLYRFALYTMKQTQDAEDVVSETVVTAYEKLHQLKKEESFRSWIFTILANQCKKHFRKNGNTDELIEGVAVQEVNHEENQDIRNAFMQLNEDDRMIIACSVFGGYPSEEIGSMMQMNPATVRSRKARALEKMRQMLE